MAELGSSLRWLGGLGAAAAQTASSCSAVSRQMRQSTKPKNKLLQFIHYILVLQFIVVNSKKVSLNSKTLVTENRTSREFVRFHGGRNNQPKPRAVLANRSVFPLPQRCTSHVRPCDVAVIPTIGTTLSGAGRRKHHLLRSRKKLLCTYVSPPKEAT